MASQRKDFGQKFTKGIDRQIDAMLMVAPALGAGTNSMAKSVLDDDCFILRTQLQHKCPHTGVWLDEVNESFATQECPDYQARTGPNARASLMFADGSATAAELHMTGPPMRRSSSHGGCTARGWLGEPLVTVPGDESPPSHDAWLAGVLDLVRRSLERTQKISF